MVKVADIVDDRKSHLSICQKFSLLWYLHNRSQLKETSCGLFIFNIAFMLRPDGLFYFVVAGR